MARVPFVEVAGDPGAIIAGGGPELDRHLPALVRLLRRVEQPHAPRDVEQVGRLASVHLDIEARGRYVSVARAALPPEASVDGEPALEDERRRLALEGLGDGAVGSHKARQGVVDLGFRAQQAADALVFTGLPGQLPRTIQIAHVVGGERALDE